MYFLNCLSYIKTACRGLNQLLLPSITYTTTFFITKQLALVDGDRTMILDWGTSSVVSRVPLTVPSEPWSCSRFQE